MSKLAFLFPGQGSQYVGMGKAMYDKYPLVKQIFEEANDILGYNISKICFEGGIEELTKTEITQPAILTVSFSAYQVYMKEIGITPVFCAGHSLGEYSALTCSGALKFSDALKIVSLRGRFMQEAVASDVGIMAAVDGIERDIVEKTCKSIYESEKSLIGIACFNSPKQIVVSGEKKSFEIFKEKLGIIGAKIVLLKVSAPFHSSMMCSAATKLNEVLVKYEYSDLNWPVISNVTAKPYFSKDDIVYNLLIQMTEPVRWQESIIYLHEQGVDVCVEMGPQSVLKDLMKQITNSIIVHPFESISSLADTRKVLLSNNFDEVKSNASKVIDRCLAIAICTQNNNWNSVEYYNGVIKPYKKMKEMKEIIEKSGCVPNIDQMREAIEILKTVFCTKKVPIEEQKERFNQILNETNTNGVFFDLIKQEEISG